METPKINLYGEWRGIDVNQADSISVVLMIEGKAEYIKGNNDTLYGNWRIDTVDRSEYHVYLRVHDPYKPEEIKHIGPMEVLFLPNNKIELRMDIHTILKRHCDYTENISNAQTISGDIQKIEYTYEDIPVLYYQNYKMSVTPEKVRVIIQNFVDEEVIVDQTYPITSSQFLEASSTLESFQIKNVDFQIYNGCTEGIRKEISYDTHCGPLFKGWSFECGQKTYGNISQYIDALAVEIKSLIPEDAHIFEKSDRIMDSLMIKGKYTEKYLTKSMYKILGMLSEYNSRFNFYTGKPRPNYVEGFSTNEKALAGYFEKCIQGYREECHLNFGYRKIESNGYLRFESAKLSKIINAFYVMIDGTATLDHKIFEDASRKNKLDYSESAYRRFGKKNKNLIHMSNANYKIKTLGIILEELGCTDIITYYYPSVPTRFTVFFMPTGQVKDLLKIDQILTKKDILPELEAGKQWEKELNQRTRQSIYFDVSQLYYDPTNSNWNIEYRGPSDAHIEISVYNIYGQRIALVLDDKYNPEKHSYIPWDTSNYTSGIYFFYLRVDGIVQADKWVKIVLVK